MSDYDDMVSIAKIKIAGRQFSRSLATERTARLAAEARVKQVEDELRKLIHAYVVLLETGRERMINLGYSCDPVDVLEQNDPFLQRGRSTLHPGEGG